MTPSAWKGVFALLALFAAIGGTDAASDSTHIRPGADGLAAAHSPTVAPFGQNQARRRAGPTAASVSISGHSALGCYQDDSDFVRDGASLRDAHMTPQLCRDFCSAGVTPVFGIKAGVECHCKVDVELMVALAEGEECSLPCPGDDGPSCRVEPDWMMVYAATDDEAPIMGREEEGLPAATAMDEATDEESSIETDPTSYAGGSSYDRREQEHAHDHDHERSSAPGGVNLGTGTTIGIAVGAVALSGVITGIVMLLFCRRRRGREERALSLAPSRGESIYERTGPLPPPPPMSWEMDRRRPKQNGVMSTTVSYSIPEGREQVPDRDLYEMSERR